MTDKRIMKITTPPTTLAPLSAILLTLLAVAAGCMPVELSVSKEGKVLVPRQEGFYVFDVATGQATAITKGSEKEQPAFGVFATDAKSVVTATKAGGRIRIDTITLADKVSKTLCKESNVIYLRLSPDGKTVSINRLADKAVKPFEKKNLPELILVDVATKTRTVPAANVSAIHRWFPDSKHILTFRILSKHKDKDEYTGQLVKMDPTGKTVTPLAEVLGADKIFFDLSPDGKSVLFTALAAAKVGAEVPKEAKGKLQLFALDIPTGVVQTVKNKAGYPLSSVKYAIYSPDGKAVLMGIKESNSQMDLHVGDSKLAKTRKVASDAAEQAGGSMGAVEIYPCWFDNDTFLYLRLRTVYGTQGQNLQLTSIDAPGKNVQNLQPALEQAIEKSNK